MRGLRLSFLSEAARHDRAWAELASAAADGELSGAEADRYRRHSAACPRCASRTELYRRQTTRLRGEFNRAPAPPARLIFTAIERRGRWNGALTPRGVVVTASAAAILFAVIASPAIRDRAAALGNGLRTAFSPSSGSLRASLPRSRPVLGSQNSAARAVLFRTDATGGPATAVGDLTGDGPLYVLPDGRLLTRAGSDDSSENWITLDADGTARSFDAAAGAEVVDVTPDGRRILLRHLTAAGDFSTDAGATVVLDASGNTIWQDPGGADVYSLSPDGRYALSGDSTGIREIPLDGGDSTLIPLDRHPVHRPQLSLDGKRAVFLAERIGPGEPALALAFARVGDAGYQVLSGGAVSIDPPPPFRLSPDGRYLAAEMGAAPGEKALTIFDMDGGGADQVAALRGAAIHRLTWSPNGRRLLILASRGGRNEAWIRDQDGALTRLGADSDVLAAAWLPDSSGALFAGR